MEEVKGLHHPNVNLSGCERIFSSSWEEVCDEDPYIEDLQHVLFLLQQKEEFQLFLGFFFFHVIFEVVLAFEVFLALEAAH